jgi:hypothetical protein
MNEIVHIWGYGLADRTGAAPRWRADPAQQAYLQKS